MIGVELGLSPRDLADLRVEQWNAIVRYLDELDSARAAAKR